MYWCKIILLSLFCVLSEYKIFVWYIYEVLHDGISVIIFFIYLKNGLLNCLGIMSVTFWWILRKHDTIRWTFCHDPSKIGESSRWSSRVHQHANNAGQDLNNYDIPHKLNSIIVICAARIVNHANKSQYRPNLKVKLIFLLKLHWNLWKICLKDYAGTIWKKQIRHLLCSNFVCD